MVSLNNIKIKNKLILMLGLPLLYLFYLSTTGVMEKSRISAEMSSLQELSKLAVKASAVIHETQKERGMTAGYLGSKGKKFAKELPEQRERNDSKISEMKQFLQDFDSSRFGNEFKATLEAGLKLIDEREGNRSAVTSMKIATGEAIRYYTSINTALLNTITYITKLSNDAELTSMIAAYVNFLQGKERAGIERAVLSGTFGADRFGPGMFNKFSALVTMQEVYKNVFLSFATPEHKQFFRDEVKGEAVNEVARMRKVAFDRSAEGGFGEDALHWFKMKTEEINLLKDVEDRLSVDLNAMAGKSMSEAESSLIFFAGMTALVLAVTIFLAFIITRGISNPIDMLRSSMEELASGEGDLTKRMDIVGKDEIAQTSAAFNRFMEGLHKIISNVKSSAEQLASSAEEISAASEQMAAGAENQMKQTDQVATAVEEMSATVLEVAKNSNDASEFARKASEVAMSGGDVVRETVDGMSRISFSVMESAKTIEALGKSSDEIGEIIAVIDDIADQTNLLALNAAIEAARAGEQGRGFAVVADEVRKLAERTTKATKEIASMIKSIQGDTDGAVKSMSAGTEEVHNGVGLANKAGESLEQIVEVVGSVTDMIQQIATAAEEQSAAAEEISTNVESVASITKETAGGARESSVATQELTRLASDLQQMVGQFRLT